MSDTILIAGLSGRMLAASARRAGFVPLVADAFGDTDTRQLAGAFELIDNAVTRGFSAGSLIAALQRLESAASMKPVGLVLGSGFEDDPDLVATLARRWRLIGCGPETVRRAKDPRAFVPLLREAGISHPETRLAPPADPAGWLVRRVGGSGGTHIRAATADDREKPGVYFQRRLVGQPVSLSGVVGRRNDAALSFTRQWTSPTARRPFRFGGAVGPVTLDPDLEARMIDDALSLIRALDLVGLVSFDFLAVDGAPVLLEVNPRPSATLDILDNAAGTLFAAHVAACLGDGLVSRLVQAAPPPPDGARALCYVYADAGPVRIPAEFAWPEWVADRPGPGSTVQAGQPLATVLGAGTGADAAAQQTAERSRHLQSMLYAS